MREEKGRRRRRRRKRKKEVNSPPSPQIRPAKIPSLATRARGRVAFVTIHHFLFFFSNHSVFVSVKVPAERRKRSLHRLPRARDRDRLCGGVEREGGVHCYLHVEVGGFLLLEGLEGLLEGLLERRLVSGFGEGVGVRLGGGWVLG